MKYKCSVCGGMHEEIPAIAFSSPFQYHNLSEDEKNELAELDEDFCVIKYEDQTDRFIRVVLVQKINNSCQNLEYGLWVSLSEVSFNNYRENYHSENYEEGYFGWLCSQIPEYENTINLKTSVFTKKNNQRPIIEIQKSNDLNNPFVRDYFEGISEEEALSRIDRMMS